MNSIIYLSWFNLKKKQDENGGTQPLYDIITWVKGWMFGSVMWRIHGAYMYVNLMVRSRNQLKWHNL